MRRYKIAKIGSLKYQRLKSMSVLKSQLESFDHRYSNVEIKELLDNILSNGFNEEFDEIYKRCFDQVFIDNEYQTIEDDDEDWSGERNFPEDYIPAIAP